MPRHRERGRLLSTGGSLGCVARAPGRARNHRALSSLHTGRGEKPLSMRRIKPSINQSHAVNPTKSGADNRSARAKFTGRKATTSARPSISSSRTRYRRLWLSNLDATPLRPLRCGWLTSPTIRTYCPRNPVDESSSKPSSSTGCALAGAATQAGGRAETAVSRAIALPISVSLSAAQGSVGLAFLAAEGG